MESPPQPGTIPNRDDPEAALRAPAEPLIIGILSGETITKSFPVAVFRQSHYKTAA
jgi:hypothetical protein